MQIRGKLLNYIATSLNHLNLPDLSAKIVIWHISELATRNEVDKVLEFINYHGPLFRDMYGVDIKDCLPEHARLFITHIETI